MPAFSVEVFCRRQTLSDVVEVEFFGFAFPTIGGVETRDVVAKASFSAATACSFEVRLDVALCVAWDASLPHVSLILSPVLETSVRRHECAPFFVQPARD